MSVARSTRNVKAATPGPTEFERASCRPPLERDLVVNRLGFGQSRHQVALANRQLMFLAH